MALSVFFPSRWNHACPLSWWEEQFSRASNWVAGDNFRNLVMGWVEQLLAATSVLYTYVSTLCTVNFDVAKLEKVRRKITNPGPKFIGTRILVGVLPLQKMLLDSLADPDSFVSRFVTRLSGATWFSNQYMNLFLNSLFLCIECFILSIVHVIVWSEFQWAKSVRSFCSKPFSKECSIAGTVTEPLMSTDNPAKDVVGVAGTSSALPCLEDARLQRLYDLSYDVAQLQRARDREVIAGDPDCLLCIETTCFEDCAEP